MESLTMMTTDHILVEERNEKMQTDYMKLKIDVIRICTLDQMINEYCSHIII